MYDELGVLQAPVTKTSTFNGSGYDLKNGANSLVARVLYSAASQASGSGTVAFKIQHSDDDSTFYDLTSGAADTITLTTSDQDGEIFIPVATGKKYIRLVCTITNGTSPTVTYESQLGLSQP